MEKKILVTGGAGFIGSRLIKDLVRNKSCKLYSLDNYFTGKPENHIGGVTYIHGDCRDVEKLVDFSPDIVYHFGEYSRVATSFEDYQKVWSYNVAGTHKILEFCKKNRCRLIYSASSTKFGDSGKNKDCSPYAFHKAQNTDLINNYGKWFGLDYIICYFYNVYGAGQISEGKYATVIGIFERQSTEGAPLTVVKPGTQRRDFTHIDDIVCALRILQQAPAGDGYCIGTNKSYDIIQVAKMFGDNIVYLDKRPGERFTTDINLNKMHSLNWTSKINLEEYIKNFKENKK
tara:strand:+ start:2035 stop:2898 length:864 start_codon:yes stop_codon:yes gene_type:complete